MDIVVGLPPGKILTQTWEALHAIGLHPIVVNVYDAGGSASVYMATEDATDGLQLDMYFDPRARGRFGLRTDALLANSVRGARWPLVAREYRAVYLLRKRHWKDDRRSVDLIRQELRGLEAVEIDNAIEAMARKEVAASIRRLLQGDWHSFAPPVRNRLADQQRRLKRLLNPVGFWAEIICDDSEHLARDVTQRFGKILMTQAGQSPIRPISKALWLVREVAPLRWKPGLYISWSRRIPVIARADLQLIGTTTRNEELACRVVRAMEARLKIRRRKGTD